MVLSLILVSSALSTTKIQFFPLPNYFVIPGTSSLSPHPSRVTMHWPTITESQPYDIWGKRQYNLTCQISPALASRLFSPPSLYLPHVVRMSYVSSLAVSVMLPIMDELCNRLLLDQKRFLYIPYPLIPAPPLPNRCTLHVKYCRKKLVICGSRHIFIYFYLLLLVTQFVAQKRIAEKEWRYG